MLNTSQVTAYNRTHYPWGEGSVPGTPADKENHQCSNLWFWARSPPLEPKWSCTVVGSGGFLKLAETAQPQKAARTLKSNF